MSDSDPKPLETKLKRALTDSNPVHRREVASKENLPPEVLFYLAYDDDVGVRRAIANNPKAPLHIASKLVSDPDSDVRVALAYKIAAALPTLSDYQQSKVYALVVQSLERMVKDQVSSVRLALANTLKDVAYVPPKVVNKLARDTERQIAEPMLRLCAALSEGDLLMIIQENRQELGNDTWILDAIASREKVQPRVSEAIYQTGDIAAVATLLGNTGAKISMEVLEKIVDDARDILDWQEPLVKRPQLPPNLATQLQEFVQESLKETLQLRIDLDTETTEDVLHVFRRRLAWADRRLENLSLVELVEQLATEGKLDDQTIGDALAMEDMEFVIIAIALRSKTSKAVVLKIMQSHNAKAIMALVWKAGLHVRLAIKIQRILGRIPDSKIMQAKYGFQYPLTEEEMNLQLGFFGL